MTQQYSYQERILQRANTDKFNIPFPPSTVGDTPDYIIITDVELLPVFQNFANYKTKKGIPTQIVTTSQIYGHYSGIDNQEKIRNYLKDVCMTYHRDDIFILLGGDTNYIPTRIGLREGVHIRITDAYYSDVYDPNLTIQENLSYNWNSNNDADFTNDYHYVLGLDNIIGRAPVKNIVEAQKFINKIINYENDSNLNNNYIKNIMMIGAYSSYTSSTIHNNGGQNDVKNFNSNATFLNSYNKLFLLDDHQDYTSWTNGNSEELDLNHLLNRLNNGQNNNHFHFIYHIDHSNPYQLGASSEMKSNLLSIPDVDALSNGNDLQIVFTDGCEPGEFDKDCIAEHYVNANSGAIAIMANTGFGYFGQHQMAVDFFDEIITNQKTGILGYASNKAKNYSRYQGLKLTLFGDPSMMVWSDTPQPITLQVPQSIDIDTTTDNTYTVTINALNESATITLYKYNNTTQEIEVYAMQEIPAGQTTATFYLHPDTEGALTVTATAKNYIPATATTQINMPQAHLYVTHVQFTDANGNNAIEPGENIDLQITLTNSGGADISNIQTSLSIDSQQSTRVNILQNQADYPGTIHAGQSINLSGYNFVLNPNNDLPTYLKFWLQITDNNGYTHNDEFYLEVTKTGLEKGTHYIKDDNDTYVLAPDMTINQEYNFYVQLRNIGDVAAQNISAVLTSSSPDIEIIQNSSPYAQIEAHNEVFNSNAYRIKLINTPGNQGVPLALTVTNAFGQSQAFDFNLFDAYPDIISGYHFTSTENSITLLWEPLRDAGGLVNINGYNIYRSNTLNGTYEKINDRLISGSSRYTDETADPLSTYYYKISVVSTTNLEIPLDILLTNPADYNNGVAVQGYKAWTILANHQGYPITHTIMINLEASPTVFDVDGDGNKEIFSQGNNWCDVTWYDDYNNYANGGRIFAYDHQGHELFNIDGNTTNIEGFALTRQQIRAKLGIFDLDRDGLADIFAIDRKNGDSSAINAFKIIDTHIDNFDRPDHFWDYPDYNDWSVKYGYNTIIPPAFADVNNDGFNEIIILDEHQKLHIFDKDKQELFSYHIPEINHWCNNSLSIGDIDNDGYMNIVYEIQYNSNNKAAIYNCQYNGNIFNVNLIKEISNYTQDQNTSIVLGDLNNDDTLDIVCYVKTGSNSYKLYALDANGNSISNWPANGIDLNNPHGLSIGQINNDDYLEVVVTESDNIKIFDYNGQVITTIPTTGHTKGVPIIADVDTDDDMEIIVNEDGFLNAYNINSGNLVSGWGLRPVSEHFTGSPVISPLDTDKNCVAMNDDGTTIYAWNTTGDSDKIEWGSERYNAQNTACYTKLSGMDLTVKDGTDDPGLEPNNVTQHLWTSSDIWIRNHDDGGTQHQNPVFDINEHVFVYVRVTNRGNVASTHAEHLKLYWGKARTDLYWPDPWTGNYYETDSRGNQVQMGNMIGDVQIPILQPGESRIIKFPWHIPDPERFRDIDPNPWHYCLLARIESPNDPMTFAETSDLVQNVKNNNNIAWKNITVVNVGSVNHALIATVGVGNMTGTQQISYLELIKDENETGNPIFEEAEVKIKMDDALYTAWQRGGEYAEEVENTSDAKKKKVKNNNVILDNLIFNPHEIGTITLTFNFLTEKITNKDKFTYHLIQRDKNTNQIIGGETFIIQKQPRPLFLAVADDKAADKGDIITLSAQNINEAAIYNWYDMDGNLIYQGEDMTVSADMAKKFKLEVIATADGFKDYKEVSVTLKPNRIVNMSPNPADNQVNINYKINEGNDAYLMIINISGNNNAVGNYVLDLNTDNIAINMSNYPTGVYSVVLVTDGNITDVQELIKE